MTELEQAAHDFVEANRAADSADEAGAPAMVLRQMRRDAEIAKAAMLNSAERFFDRVFDGAPA